LLESNLAICGFSRDEICSIDFREVADEDWLSEWKKHWRSVEIGKFVISPPWESVAMPDKTVIRIEPNMAFGTGTHDTTQLCLRAISENYKPQMSLLDVGTGTGILAIAAAKLAATRSAVEAAADIEKALDDGDVSAVRSSSPVANIMACDTDPDSVKIARENAELNGVGDSVEFFEGSISDATPEFDFVCANLTLDVIAPLLPPLMAKTRSILLLSGILASQRDDITGNLDRLQTSDLKGKIRKFEISQSGEWISVLVRFSRVF
jgi:ribosomal protein L11 methyltransferase